MEFTQCDHSPGEPGKVRELESGQEEVGETIVSFYRPAMANTLNNEMETGFSFVCIFAIAVPQL